MKREMQKSLKLFLFSIPMGKLFKSLIVLKTILIMISRLQALKSVPIEQELLGKIFPN